MRFQRFYLKYFTASEEKTIESSDFSEYSNDDLSISFTLEDFNGNTLYAVSLIPKKTINLTSFHIVKKIDYTEVRAIFCNGFQSWTKSKNFVKDDVIQPLRRGIKRIAQAYGDELIYDFKTRKGNLHSWTYTTLQLPDKKVHLFGSADEYTGYTLFEHNPKDNLLYIAKDVTGWKVNERIDLIRFTHHTGNEWLCWQAYLSTLKLKELHAKPAIGWTSWYYYYVDITEQIITDNLHAFKNNNIPIEIFQIDDGWQKSVGDWLNVNEKFPNGMRFLSDKIHEQDCKAGLWLAPLACEQKSFIVKEKPDWILKDASGQFLKIGFNPMWSYWFYALDIYHPEVRAYLKEVFDTILQKWNFNLVKLDFLYGTALIPRNGKTRATIMHETMQFLRECVGDKMILGCGVPLSAAMNTTDYCRIGPDVHLSWDFKFLKWIRARERPSILNAIHNAVNRRQLGGKWFWNDPDVFILRDNKNKLSFNEKYALLLTNLLFGQLLFTSDNIAEYDEEMLFLYKSIFPLVSIEDVHVRYQNQLYVVNCRIADKYYTCLINTADKDRMYKLPNGLFFEHLSQKLIKGDRMYNLHKHQAVCLLNVGYSPFAFAGSKGHFFSGTEMERFFISGNELEIEWNEKVLNEISVQIKVPLHYEVKSVNGNSAFTRTDFKEYSIITIEKDKRKLLAESKT